MYNPSTTHQVIGIYVAIIFFLERTAKALPRILLDDKKKNKNLYREKTA
jgi:hypothetical protein